MNVLLRVLRRAHDHSGMTPAEQEEVTHEPYEETPKYARAVVYFVCGAIAIFAILRAIFAFRKRSPSVVKSGLYRRGAAAGRYISSRQQEAKGFKFYTVGVGLLLLAFFLFSMIWTWAARPYYYSKWYVGSAPLALRTGFLALGCFPFIFAFASKWNIVTFVTGHSHEKLQVYHQMISHIFLVLSWIHTIPFLIQGLSQEKPGYGGIKELNWSMLVARKVYYWTGVILLVFLAILCWASLPWIRNRNYELFKYLHVFTAVLFIPFFFLHCNKLLGSWDYCWATVAIYGLAVISRFGWMIITNFRDMPEATFELMPAGMVKLSIKWHISRKWRPGQHFFIHFLSVAPFQSHPFTIASIPDDDNDLVIFIRQANGITKRLAGYLANKDTAKIPLWLDGPFGGPQTDLSIFEHVVLIGGGTGFTFILPLLQDLARKFGPDDCTCTSVEVLWSVREEEAIQWMLADLEKIVKAAPSSSITIKIHVTGGPTSKASSEEDLKEKSPSRGVALSYPYFGRADIPTLISRSAAQSQTVGVATCGPESLVFDVRNAVADVQKCILTGRTGCQEMFLHTEEYSW